MPRSHSIDATSINEIKGKKMTYLKNKIKLKLPITMEKKLK